MLATKKKYKSILKQIILFPTLDIIVYENHYQ